MAVPSTSRHILRWIVILAVLAGGGYAVWRYLAKPAQSPLTFETATVDSGSVVLRVRATGTLYPLVNVQVGSQVSGRIAEIFVDFNDRVHTGQVLAQIDTTTFEAAVEQANARYSAARAQRGEAEARAENARRNAERLRGLADRNLVSGAEAETAESELIVALAQVDTAEANVTQARAARDEARANLELTTITSPIDGIVISRGIELGQTVAASLSAPVLFVIAEDLSRMQVDTSVSEADVGQLRDGMAATFTVDAFPERTFPGTLRQVRYAAETVQNVVTYDAIVDVANDALDLRPGMTASVTFVVDERDEVMRLPNAALRFRAPAAMSCEPPGQRGGSGEAPVVASDEARRRGSRGQRGAGDGPAGRAEMRSDATDDGSGDARPRRTIWVQRNGTPTCVSVALGLNDGSFTEVVDGDIGPGDEVITGASGGEEGERPRRGFRL